MRLSGLGPSPSLFIQKQRQNHGQVDDLEEKSNNRVEQENKNSIKSSGEGLVDGSTQSKKPLDDPNVRAQVMELQTIEDKVIAHEQAHQAAGGEFTGGASYGYTTGPDGKRYITSGEVSISIPSTGDPEELYHVMERVRAAALAPADPSGQDQSVAASATARMASLRSDISKQKATQAYGDSQNKSEDTQRDQTQKERQHVDVVI